MAAKTSWHRYEIELRYCNLMHGWLAVHNSDDVNGDVFRCSAVLLEMNEDVSGIAQMTVSICCFSCVSA